MLEERLIDHIVYAVPDLEPALHAFEEKTGVRPAFGGYHADQGTKNAIVNIGQGAYLEIIAIDQANTAIAAPRWMGVDLIRAPQITRWSLKSDHLDVDSKALVDYHPEMGQVQAGHRKTDQGAELSWMMIMPLSHPIVEIAPFVTSWGADSVHPTTNLPQECNLLDLQFTHPNPEILVSLWRALGLRVPIQTGTKPQIGLLLETPKGTVAL